MSKMTLSAARWLCLVVFLTGCADETPGGVGDTARPPDSGAGDLVSDDATVPMDIQAPDVIAPRDTDGPLDAARVDLSGPDLDAAVTTDTSLAPSTGRIPRSTEPCKAPSYWPYSVAGGSPFVRVHYRDVSEEATALEILEYARFTLPWQITNLGFRMPPSDGGRCGPDDALDIFVWRDAPSTYTDLVQSVPSTWWEDVSPYVVIDAFGDLGGQWLPSTVTHELNHVLQAADSWYDSPIAYEMTAMYVEDVVYDDDNNYLELLDDFQSSPQLSLDYDDSYDTLYMYGACIYLQYLEARHYRADPTFIGRVWFGMRNDPSDNEPDLLDALDAELTLKGSSYIDSVLEFARWRWYTGRRDDGRHLPEAGAHPDSAAVAVAQTLAVDSTAKTATIRNMVLGTTYIQLTGAANTPVAVTLSGSAAVQWVVQALPGLDGDDGVFVLSDLGDGDATLAAGGLVLAVTALPGPLGDIDPDTRSQTTYQATLTVTRGQAGP